MAYRFNPFTGKLDELGPVLTGTGTVSAAADGTAALPGIAFASDLNTGIYRPGADQVAISTNGTGRLFIDASGNVGIGTTVPEGTLHVNAGGTYPSYSNLIFKSSANYETTLYLNNGSPGHHQITANAYTEALTINAPYSAQGNIRFNTAGSERARITSTGELKHLGGGTEGSPAVYFSGSAPSNSLYVEATTGHVGIGTSSLNTKFDVAGSSQSYTNAPAITFTDTGSGQATANRWIAGNISVGNYGDFALAVAPNTTSISFSPKIVVTEAGNVGIGTTSPAKRLHVVGDSNGSITSGESAIRAYSADSTAYLSLQYDGIDGTIASNPSAAKIAIGINGTERARIDSSGRLLVGTSSSSSSSIAVFQGFAGGSTGPGIAYFQRGQTAPTSNAEIGQIFFANSSGNIGSGISAIADANWTAGSSHPTRLVFSTCADGASSPTERMRIKSDGTINFSNVSVYADNAAAKAGGLVDGDVYRTSTGDLKIVYT